MKKKTHETYTTTMNVNASAWPYSCGFFCQRLRTSDVIDPSSSAKLKVDTPKPTKTSASG